MGDIKLNNSYCTLDGFNTVDIEKVKRSLTYTNEETILQKQLLYSQIKKAGAKRNIPLLMALKQKFKDLGPDQVCWLNKDNQFPTGLLHLVKESLTSSKYTLSDERIKPNPYNTFRWYNKPHSLRYYQQEAVDVFLNKGRGVLQLACGAGKTRIATEIIKNLGVNTLFVVPSSALLTQAYDIFVLAFGERNVQKISTTDMKKDKVLKPIRVATIQTLASLNKQGLIRSPLKDVDLLICDEAHHMASDSYTDLLNALQPIYFRLNMTATYTRNDSKLMDLQGMSGEIIYDYNAVQATKEGYLTPVEFKIIPLSGKPDRNYQNEYKINYKSKELLESIKDLIVNEIPSNEPILILIDKKEHSGDVIHNYLIDAGIECSYVTGDNTKEEIKEAIENFNDNKTRILIGSTVFGEGCDLRTTTHLIMARGGKSEIMVTQAIGRAIRLSPGKTVATVYDFNMKYTKYMTKHLMERVEIYQKQFAGKVTYE